MYVAEVMNKLPVAQHFLFGSILPYQGPPPPEREMETDGHGHLHEKNTWGDCCGIPVPSGFAAAQEKVAGARLSGPSIKPVPFD